LRAERLGELLQFARGRNVQRIHRVILRLIASYRLFRPKARPDLVDGGLIRQAGPSGVLEALERLTAIAGTSSDALRESIMFQKTIRILHRVVLPALALLALVNNPDAAAADAPSATPAAPPRIAVALSGGGARGIAHVGVLKVLDEMRIPISCITGTSMGSIVAGAFAVGRSPAEIEQMVLATNWDEIFRDNPPREEIAIRRKLDDYKTLFAPEFGVKDGGLALPKGVIAGISIEAFLRVAAEPATGINDFDKLPVPFRAVATDIETGEAVVLSHGNLAEAMRASMSVPGAITPVQMDGRLLVDGMIANNLPIDQARKLCGDVVIAVDIGTPPLRRDEITSVLSVVSQMMAFLGKHTVDQQIKSLGPNDVLIVPDLGDISVADYGRSKDAIRIGEEGARKMAASLERYSLPPEQYAALRAKQAKREVALAPVEEIRFEGLQRTNAEVLRALVETKPGEPLDDEKLGADLRRIYGRGDFEGIDASVVGSAGGPRVGDHAAREGVGARLSAIRPRAGERLPWRQRVQPAGSVPQDVAKPARRRMADRRPSGPGYAPLQRVLPTT